MIRVCLVDDQTLVRQGIRSLLALDGGIEVVAEAGDGRQAVDLIPQGTALIINDMSSTPKVHFTGALVIPVLYKAEEVQIKLINLDVDRRGRDDRGRAQHSGAGRPEPSGVPAGQDELVTRAQPGREQLDDRASRMPGRPQRHDAHGLSLGPIAPSRAVTAAAEGFDRGGVRAMA